MPQGYFEGLGFGVPERSNPADVFMDIISGARGRDGGNAVHLHGAASPPRRATLEHAATVRGPTMLPASLPLPVLLTCARMALLEMRTLYDRAKSLAAIQPK